MATLSQRMTMTTSSAARCSRPAATQWPMRTPAVCSSAQRLHRASRRALVCQAQKGNPTSLSRTFDTMLKRYDFVSTGMGALCVTCYFWAHGQAPLEALTITAVSTVTALVVNELFFMDNSK